ncbi:MAG: hypothetical protein EZS28_022406 [Streblomastix strix]|uniref:Uncharacterized protein n=1 Tax=Streblomastix strix TaxID=222440 RepID=A0A5J4VHI4_9EUKA|nr:MAG: hypothetical protein EZS28_022406 [Streblomastix strix]
MSGMSHISVKMSRRPAKITTLFRGCKINPEGIGWLGGYVGLRVVGLASPINLTSSLAQKFVSDYGHLFIEIQLQLQYDRCTYKHPIYRVAVVM